MNELLFCIQAFAVFGFTVLAAKRGWLAGWMGLLTILANLFVTKQITLFGLEVTASDVYAVGLFLSLNILQEYWGDQEAKRGIEASLASQLMFLLLSQLHLWLHPSSHDTSQSAFAAILSFYPRILAASVATLCLVQVWEVRLFGWMKRRYFLMSFNLRNVLCLLISQALDTLIFGFLGLYGIVNDLVAVMVWSFLVKAILTMAVPLLTPYLRRYVVQV